MDFVSYQLSTVADYSAFGGEGPGYPENFLSIFGEITGVALKQMGAPPQTSSHAWYLPVRYTPYFYPVLHVQY